jgi:hypothetical protein
MRGFSSTCYTYILTLGALLVASLGQVGAQDKYKRSVRNGSLAEPAAAIDRSVGRIDVGQLVLGLNNSGKLNGLNYDFESDVEIERVLPGAWFKGYSYIRLLGLMIAVPEGPWTPRGEGSPSQGPTVHAGWELGPRKGSKGQLFSGDVTIGQIVPRGAVEDNPVMATSTLPHTWPEGFFDGSGSWISTPGERHWPGPWAVDPGVDGIARTEDDSILVGQFTGDQELFFSITDFDLDARGIPYCSNPRGNSAGYPIYVQVDIHAIGYGRSYAEDCIFFSMRIVYRGTDTLQGVYLGIWLISDAPTFSEHGFVGDANDDWVGFIRTDDEDGIDYNMAFIYDPSYAYTATKLLDTPISSHDIDLDGDEVIDVREGDPLGITDWHYVDGSLDWPGYVTVEHHHWEQYKIISGGSKATLWDASDSTWGDFVVSKGEVIEADTLSDGTPIRLLPQHHATFFHGDLSSHIDEPPSITEDPAGGNYDFLMSSGPFTLRPGDTTGYTFALIMGEDLRDLKLNARTAQTMYNKNYLGADAPLPPAVTAVPGDRRVTLYWDDAAEHSTDLATEYKDFEGYKIYRTTRHPTNNMWGEEIVDGTGKVVGFSPIAQFDLNNSVEGLDPEYPHLDRGSNSGLVHLFVDSSVSNGTTYWYSVCSYDRGINSENDSSLNPDDHVNLNYLECPKGNNPALAANLVKVTPGKRPVGYQLPEAGDVHPDPDSLGKGSIVPLLVNPDLARETHTYTITFDDTTTPGAFLYSVVDEHGATLVVRSGETGGSDAGPVFNGVKMFIEEHTSVEFRDKRWVNVSSDTSTFVLSDMAGHGTPKPSDYLLHFYDSGVPQQLGMYVYNVTDDPNRISPLVERVLDVGLETGNHTVEIVEPYGDAGATSRWTFSLAWSTTHIPLDTVISGSDTTIRYITVHPEPPSPGDEFLYRTIKPLTSGDQFSFTVQGASQDQTITDRDLQNVRVVPNPYLVTAAWELSPTQKRLAFTNLPPTCTIEIFTVTGELVERITRQDATEGWEWWDLLNSSNRMVSYGLYVYVVTVPGDAKTIGKFAVIR